MRWTVKGMGTIPLKVLPRTAQSISPFWTEQGGIIQPLDPKSVMTTAANDTSSTDLPVTISAERMTEIYRLTEESYQRFSQRQREEERRMSLSGLSKMAPGNWEKEPLPDFVADILREAGPSVPLMPKQSEKPKPITVAPVALPRRTFNFGDE